MSDFMNRPVRNLSLGQRIHANIAISLLHEPKILYLDEPTIGLDVVAKSDIRKFIRQLNKEKGTTLILTTHDMSDIESMCDRIIMIDDGMIMYDGKMDDFKREYGGEYIIKITVDNMGQLVSHARLELTKKEGSAYYFRGNHEEFPIPNALSHFFSQKVTT